MTNAGTAMLNEMMAGRVLKVTGVRGGSGLVEEEKLAEQTGLVNEKQTLSITGEEDTETGKTLQIRIFNESVKEEYRLEQVGVYAQLDPDKETETEPELLFIMQDRDGVTIPKGEEEVFLLDLYCAIQITNTGRFRVEIDAAGIATVESVQRAVEKGVAAHNTDKEAHPDIRAELKTASEAAAAAAQTAGAADKTAKEAAAAAAEAKKAADTASKSADAALKAIGDMTNRIDVVPSQNGTLTYTGAAQSPVWNSYNPEALELGGETEGTDAKTYHATFTPKGDYKWNGGDKNPKTVDWVIRRAALSGLPTQSGTCVYDGSSKSPSWTGYDPAKMTLGGQTSGTDVGTYRATFTPKSNYQWPDGGTEAREAVWAITKKATKLPSQNGTLTYTGAAQSPTWKDYNTNELTIGGAVSGTDAGTYTATFTPKPNFQWEDGSQAAKSVQWSIGKAAGTLSLDPQSLTLNSANLTRSITVTRSGTGAISASTEQNDTVSLSVSGNTVTVTGKKKGSATVKVHVEGDKNYTAPADKTCSVNVTLPSGSFADNDWSTIKEVSDGGTGANYWAVGDQKAVKLNGTVGKLALNNVTVYAFILGFNHNSGREGTGRIHFQLGKISGKLAALCDSGYNNEQTASGYFHMNTSRTNAGGWNATEMRKTILGNSGTTASPPANSLLAALPADLRTSLKPVTKYTDNTGNASNAAGNVTATSDLLFLLSEFEVFGQRNYANQYEQNYQAQYDYYKSGNSRVAYRHDSLASAVWWWLRSPYYGSRYYFCYVYTDGHPNNLTASWSAGLVAGFAV